MDFSAKLVAIIPVGNELGEGVLWRPSDQTIWWTDIQGRKLYKLNWEETEPEVLSVPLRIGSMGFIENDNSRLIIAFESGFAYYTPETDLLEWICQPEELAFGGGRRLNDGRIGPDGAFWAGSMLETGGVSGGVEQTGFYRLTAEGTARLVHKGFQISNGLCWSPDNKTIYCSDSPRSQVFKADFDVETGQSGALTAFAKTEGGVPDGAVTDSEGRYWSALWGGHRVACFDAQGTEIAALKLPVPQPTIPVFGGPALDHIIVATAHQDLSDADRARYPEAGHLFIYKTNITGLSPFYFPQG